MHSITFDCELITPLFMGGANPNDCELRAPSIKGALRFWWRALNGHLVEKKGDKWDYTKLLKEEGLLFGQAKPSPLRGSIILRVREKANFPLNKQDTKRPGLHDNEYLFYSLIHQNKEKKGIEKKEFFIEISSSDKNKLLKVASIFWIFSLLGGLGARARRGAGKINIKDVIDKENIVKDKILFSSRNDNLSGFIKTNLKSIYLILNNTTERINNITTYSNIIYSKIFIGKENKISSREALKIMNDRLSGIRKSTMERKFTIFTLDQKAAFGLPVGVRDDNAINLKNHNRRASPLFISVIKFNDKYYWAIIHFNGEFMPPDDSIYFESKRFKISKDKKKFQRDNVDPVLLNQFLNDLEKVSNVINFSDITEGVR